EVYHARQAPEGWCECSCPDFTYRRSRTGNECKHVKALRQFGLLGGPAPEPTRPPAAALPKPLPGYDEWSERMDQKYRLDVLLKAARRSLDGIFPRCTCLPGDHSCHRCVVERVVGELEPAIGGAGPEEALDLAGLEAELSAASPAA